MASRKGSRDHANGPDKSGRKLSAEYNLEKPPLSASHPPGRFQWTSFLRVLIASDDIRRRSAAIFLLLLLVVLVVIGWILVSGGLGVFARYTNSID